jgi:hypothetical protein
MRMRLTLNQLFFIDGVGAVVSTLMLGIILPGINSHIGMPVLVLHYLGLLACVFAIYSFSNILIIKPPQSRNLSFIAIINLIYCCLTAALVLYNFNSLTLIGVGYFVAEILILIGLAYVELKAALNA